MERLVRELILERLSFGDVEKKATPIERAPVVSHDQVALVADPHHPAVLGQQSILDCLAVGRSLFPLGLLVEHYPVTVVGMELPVPHPRILHPFLGSKPEQRLDLGVHVMPASVFAGTGDIDDGGHVLHEPAEACFAPAQSLQLFVGGERRTQRPSPRGAPGGEDSADRRGGRELHDLTTRAGYHHPLLVLVPGSQVPTNLYRDQYAATSGAPRGISYCPAPRPRTVSSRSATPPDLLPRARPRPRPPAHPPGRRSRTRPPALPGTEHRSPARRAPAAPGGRPCEAVRSSAGSGARTRPSSPGHAPRPRGGARRPGPPPLGATGRRIPTTPLARRADWPRTAPRDLRRARPRDRSTPVPHGPLAWPPRHRAGRRD